MGQHAVCGHEVAPLRNQHTSLLLRRNHVRELVDAESDRQRPTKLHDPYLQFYMFNHFKYFIYLNDLSLNYIKYSKNFKVQSNQRLKKSPDFFFNFSLLLKILSI